MRYLALSFILSAWASVSVAFEIEDEAQFGAEDSPQALRILSTADIAFMAPIIASFLAENADVRIDYVVASSAEVMKAVYHEGAAVDLVISSAMDLQTKLANDGHALRHTSSATETAPEWAVWNDMLFAFSQEPAAMVLSKAGFGDLALPRDRNDLIKLFRENPDRFRGRVGTYDVRDSGLGYLFATQDTRVSEIYWRLTEVMGGLDTRLYCCSSDMIEAVRSGELLIAYNVLGSYAVTQNDPSDLLIVLPTDFTTVMQRTALIPTNAASPDLAGVFVDHLLNLAHEPDGGLPGLSLGQNETALNRIRIGPGLMVFLDQLKKQAFLSEWENAILQN